jgi:inorganic pyrophosphatase
MIKSPDALPSRGKEGFHVVVESPRGSTAKFKYDPKLGAFTLSRPLPLGLHYPFDWGFVPGTAAADGDPLDALIYWEGQSPPGAAIACRPLGVLEVDQLSEPGSKKRQRNDRLLAAPIESPRLDPKASALTLPARVREELEHFFLASTHFEGKKVRVLAWRGPAEAEALLRRHERAARKGGGGAER